MKDLVLSRTIKSRFY